MCSKTACQHREKLFERTSPSDIVDVDENQFFRMAGDGLCVVAVPAVAAASCALPPIGQFACTARWSGRGFDVLDRGLERAFRGLSRLPGLRKRKRNKTDPYFELRC